MHSCSDCGQACYCGGDVDDTDVGFDESQCVCDCDEADEEELATCPHCGKAYEEFGDLGCEYCDRRHPGYGTIP